MVCLEPVAPADRARLPGCGHAFHVTCMLSFVQYDARCPVCRQPPTGVHVAEPAESWLPSWERLEEHYREMQAQMRQYADRRRRFVRDRPRVQRADADLRRLRSELNRESRSAQRLYDAKCREIWRNDPEIVAARKVIQLMRRRERRLERMLELHVDEVIGPPPQETSAYEVIPVL